MQRLGQAGITLYAVAFLGVLVAPVVAQDHSAMHVITLVKSPINIDANWEKPVWQGVEPITLNQYMGEKPEHFPAVSAKIAYDRENIYIIWKVDDQFVKAVAEHHQGPVYQDSCVEFFFIPDNLGGLEYFNLEMNCGGTMLFHHQEYGKPDKVNIAPEDLAEIRVAHSLPRLIPNEIQEETTWYLEYAIPFEILREYYKFDIPQPGAVWRANFYKCADKTSHPHWLTWSPVDNPTPKFHLPQFFGKLVFE